MTQNNILKQSVCVILLLRMLSLNQKLNSIIVYLCLEIIKNHRKKVLIMYSNGLEQKMVELPIYIVVESAIFWCIICLIILYIKRDMGS